jgi:hypothetical protein
MRAKGASKAIVVVCGVVLAACSAQPAAPADGQLAGQVSAYGGPLQAKNGPVSGQTVALIDAAHRVIATTKTDDQGMFSLSAPPGTYTVTGDVCSQAAHVVTIQSASRQTLNLVCQRR